MKRILSIVLCVLLAMGIFACSNTGSRTVSSNGISNNGGNKGKITITHDELNEAYYELQQNHITTIKFGNYQGEPIEWYVVDYRSKNNEFYLYSKKILDVKCYNETMSNSVNWENCDLRKWLNNEFYNSAFSDAEKKVMVEKEFTSGYERDMKQKVRTKDKVSLLGKEDGFDNIKYNVELYTADATSYAKSVRNHGKELFNYGSGEIDYGYWIRESDRRDNITLGHLESKWNSNRSKSDKVDTPYNGVRPLIVVKLEKSESVAINIKTEETTGEQISNERPLPKGAKVPTKKSGVENKEMTYEELKQKLGIVDETTSNNISNIFGGEAIIEGAEVVKNADGSITIGGTSQNNKKNDKLLKDYNEYKQSPDDYMVKFDSNGNLWVRRWVSECMQLIYDYTILYVDGKIDSYITDFEKVGSASYDFHWMKNGNKIDESEFRQIENQFNNMTDQYSSIY